MLMIVITFRSCLNSISIEGMVSDMFMVNCRETCQNATIVFVKRLGCTCILS